MQKLGRQRFQTAREFADAHLPSLSEAELDEFERLLDLPDPEIFSWITGEAPTPAAFDTPLFARLRAAPASALARDAETT